MYIINSYYKKVRKFLRPLKKFYNYLLNKIFSIIVLFIPIRLVESILQKKIFITHKNIKFSIRNYGSMCKLRQKTFSTKEPDTLEWIETFETNSCFIDIGANLGIYSIYASNFCERVFSFEPDALNYSILNLNILDNNLSKKITAFPLAIHNDEKFDFLNIKKYQFGGALSSFSNNKDQFGKYFTPIFNQGSYSISLEKIIKSLEIKSKIYCKIDVDGNENIIINSCKEILKNKFIKSFLVELDTSRDDYDQTIGIFLKSNYKLTSKKSSPIFKNQYETTMNHIFHVQEN